MIKVPFNRTILFAVLVLAACNQSQKRGDSGNSDGLTYTKDIAPILIKNCVPCHRDGGTAPFNLVKYEQVVRKKKTIREVVSAGIMPPWPADPTYTSFVGERYLSDIEKNQLFDWIEQGVEYGDSALLPEMPKLSLLSSLGEPDMTLYMDSIEIPGDNIDRFFIVKVPFELEENKYLRTIEFVTGKHNLVHHLNGHLLNFKEGQKKDLLAGKNIISIEQDYEALKKDFDSLELKNDDRTAVQRVHSAVNFLPGVIGTVYPEGIGGFPVSKKAAIVANDIHYGPIPKTKVDRSHFNLFFTKVEPKRPTFEFMLGTNGVSAIVPPLVIQPNEIKTCKTHYRIPADISVLTINPHMHLLGVKLLAYAITLENDTIPLIRINRWDFRWQYFYTFKKMVKIPKGSAIWVEATFDNTTDNPLNPFNPPRTVKERLQRTGMGMRTTDEMFQFIVTWIPYREGDENISLETSLSD
jgi:hypothetical protein